MDNRGEEIMIHREATIKYKGYDPDDLKPKSNKRVCCICDKCGRVSWHRFDSYRDLCNSCSHIGIPKSEEHKEKISKSHIGMKRTIEARKKHSKSISGNKNYGYGKPRSDECKEKISESNKGKLRSQETRLKMSEGAEKRWEDLEEREKQSARSQGIPYEEWTGYFDKRRPYLVPKGKCILLNDYFSGSHAHHITKSIIIYIPSDLHNHIKHNMRTGQGMAEMNMLALQYLNGCYDE